MIFQESIKSRLQHGYYLLLLARYAEIILPKSTAESCENCAAWPRKEGIWSCRQVGQRKIVVKGKLYSLYCDNRKGVLLLRSFPRNTSGCKNASTFERLPFGKRVSGKTERLGYLAQTTEVFPPVHLCRHLKAIAAVTRAGSKAW